MGGAHFLDLHLDESRTNGSELVVGFDNQLVVYNQETVYFSQSSRLENLSLIDVSTACISKILTQR